MVEKSPSVGNHDGDCCILLLGGVWLYENNLLGNVVTDPFVAAGAILFDAAALDRRDCHNGRQADL